MEKYSYKLQCPVWEQGDYMSEGNVKNCKRSEILPYLWPNNVACRNFMDADSKHKSLGSETKDSLLLIIAIVRASALLCQFLERLCPHDDTKMGFVLWRGEKNTWL